MKKIVVKEPYVTSNLYLASFLKTRDMKLIDQVRDVNKRVLFIFKESKDRKRLIQEYYNNGFVNITAFMGSLQGLKATIYYMDMG